MLKNIPLDHILYDDGLQARVTISNAKVTEYAGLYRDGVKMKPLKVFEDEKRPGYYWLGDGRHRQLARGSLALPDVECLVGTGGRRAAFLCALGANSDHGLPRTNADKRRAVVMALADEELRMWSDRKLAQQCGVRHPFVAKIRLELESDTSSEQFGFDRIRKGADGRVRRMPRRKSESSQLKKPDLAKLAPNSTPGGAGVGAAGAGFNIGEESRSLQTHLEEMMKGWPDDKRHSFCVQLREFAIGHDAEVQAMATTAFDEVLRKSQTQEDV